MDETLQAEVIETIETMTSALSDRDILVLILTKLIRFEAIADQLDEAMRSPMLAAMIGR